MEATWLVAANDAGSVRVTMIEREGGDPHTSLSLAPHTSTSTDQCATGYHTSHSPSYSPHHTPSQYHHSQGLRLKPHPSDSSASGFGSSSPTESGLDDKSDTGSSGSDSGGPKRYRSGSPDVIFLGKNEEDPADAEGEEDGSDDEEARLYWISQTQTVRKPARLHLTIRHAKAMSCMLHGDTGRFTRVMMT